jgi:hypothetical protein
MLKTLACVVVVVGCVSNTPPSSSFPSNPPPNPTGEPPNSAVGPEAAGAPMGPTGPETAAGTPDPGPTVIGNKPGSPPSPPIVTDEVPIDPTKPMPADTLGTDTALAIDQPASVMVDARGDIFSAGMAKPDPGRGGVLPTRLALVSNGGVIRIRAVRGKIGCAGDTPAMGADGGGCAGGSTDLVGAGSVSGIKDRSHSQFLVGVFLSDKPGKPPKGSDYSNNEGFAQIAPKLGEMFYVGDGMTGTSTGEIQTFKIPNGATKLYLGFAGDAYAHNAGGVSAIVTEHAK